MKENHKRNWYVVYTRSKWEKKVDQLLTEQEINSFCPVVKRKQKWADRNKVVEFPLFSSYLFVHASLLEQLQVRQTPGVVNFVYHCGKPAAVSDSEIERIRSLVKCYPDLESVGLDHLSVGDRVRVKDDLLNNVQGEIIQIQGKSVVMIVDVLNCALIVKAHHTELVV